MNAKLLLNERRVIAENIFAELIVWQVPSPVPGSTHSFKYRLALIVDGVCQLRYDNETGKGDHKHLGNEEVNYVFTSPKVLLDDFWHDVNTWRP